MTRNFVIRTAVGKAISTADSADLARKEALRQRETYPGLYIEETYTPPPVVRRIWTDRQGDNVVPLARRQA